MVVAPDRYRELLGLPKNRSWAVQGAGLSYAATAFGNNSTVIDMRRFNRILEFDASERKIRVESGLSVGSLFYFLSQHGLHLPAMPGHPQITIGGCIAADIHGKNPVRDGPFSNYVQALSLFHPSNGILEVDGDHMPELLELTCGGYGLTGIVVDATLRVCPLLGSSIETKYVSVENPTDGGKALAQASSDVDSAYGWLDLASSGTSRGSGFLALGTICSGARGATPPLNDANAPPAGRGPALFGRRTLPVLNLLYRRAQLAKSSDIKPLNKALFPAVENAVYFRGFGTKGFIEQQVLVPEHAWPNYVSELIGLVQKHRPSIALGILKHFRGAQRLLRFGGNGLSLALQICADNAQPEFSKGIDELAIQHGAVGNLVKDSRLTAGAAQRMFGEYNEFRSRLLDFDRHRLFRTALSERLAL